MDRWLWAIEGGWLGALVGWLGRGVRDALRAERGQTATSDLSLSEQSSPSLSDRIVPDTGGAA